MDLLLMITKDLSYILVQYPLYSLIASVILFGILLRFYCRLTLGRFEDDQSMDGKTVLITGASDGIGKSTALDLAKRNARVLMACRNLEKAGKVVEEIKKASGNHNVVLYHLELSSFASVRKCAEEVLKNEKELHVLINNAGISGIPRRLSEDGCEVLMQTNHFGHFLLTLLLLDLLKKCTPSRIINVSSEAHLFARLNVDDLTNRQQLRPGLVYCNSKLVNILFTRELAERLDGTGVTVNALHPGCVKTSIFRGKTDIISLLSKFLFFIVGKNSEEGAQTTIRLAVDPKLEKTNGKYFSDCKEAKISKDAKDKSQAKRLFEISEQVVGKTFLKS
ncbi:retinol dehydrogenase 11 [Parasteatoda tepidariorum]|uniref:retinol dehydrogenase 11 n=1 Tax=Parasteatoda tepidariorum TaxID=114398 RepID=UPI001C719D69|nr:retinol dehydrogenase 11 [Parasteatoda tepidariorum]